VPRAAATTGAQFTVHNIKGGRKFLAVKKNIYSELIKALVEVGSLFVPGGAERTDTFQI